MADQIPASAEVTAASIGLSVRRRVEDTEYNESQYKEFQALYEGTLGKISEGEIVKGRIVHIGENECPSTSGSSPKASSPSTSSPTPTSLKVGDEIEVFLESVENKDGQLVLSRKRADFMRDLGTRHEGVRDRRSPAGPLRPPHQGRHRGRPDGHRRLPSRLADRRPPRARLRCSTSARPWTSAW